MSMFRSILTPDVYETRQCRKRHKFGVYITRIHVTVIHVMNQPVAFCRALSDETRWRIVRLVMDRALCVCELADILAMPQSSVSSHVQIIRKADLLESETCGKWTYFRIRREYLPLLKSMLRRFPDGDRHAADHARADARMARRATSCCIGPVKLARPRKSRIPQSC